MQREHLLVRKGIASVRIVFFYAEKIMVNDALVEFLHTRGLDPLKADDIWCYTEKDGYKYYAVDFFEVYADREETHTFGNAKLSITTNSYAEKGQLSYVWSIDLHLFVS